MFTRALNALSATVIALAAAAPAGAAALSVSAGLAPTYVAPATTITGSFDLNTATGALGFSNPLSVSGGSVTFNFADNSDPLAWSSGQSTSFTDIGCILGSCFQTGQFYFVDTTLNSYVDPIEWATVTIGSMVGSAATTSVVSNSSSGLFRATHQECSSFLGICSTVATTRLHNNLPYPVYTQTVTWSYIANGGFSVAMALDSNAIADLGSDGILDFSIAATQGDFNFLSALLDVTVSGGAASNPGSGGANSVPEPGTAFLLACSLGMLGVSTRRRKQGAAAA